MNILFLMDPLSGIDPHKDTTYALMCGAHRRGHRVYYLPKDGLAFENGSLRFHVTGVVPGGPEDRPFEIKEESVLEEKDISVVWIRTDPPFDGEYLLHTWLLDHLTCHVAVLNHPSGIRTVNEKIWVAQFTDFVPHTLVGRRRRDLLAFLEEEQEIVAKPTDGYGGQSVFHIRRGGPNTHVILETLTRNFTRDIVLQKYVPEAGQGDKRILLLDGEPLGAVLRFHSEDDHRNNFFSGGTPHAAGIDDRDRKIITALRPHLRDLGLYFVGIDILGGYLIEVNVTSPTCLQEMNRLYGKTLEDDIISFTEKLSAEKKERVCEI